MESLFAEARNLKSLLSRSSLELTGVQDFLSITGFGVRVERVERAERVERV